MCYIQVRIRLRENAYVYVIVRVCLCSSTIEPVNLKCTFFFWFRVSVAVAAVVGCVRARTTTVCGERLSLFGGKKRNFLKIKQTASTDDVENECWRLCVCDFD